MQLSRRTVIAGLAAGAALPTGLARAAAGATGPIVSDIAVEDGRVWIAAKVGDRGPYFFIIDTGGFVSFINNDQAAGLGMRPLEAHDVVSVGGQRELTTYRADDVTLANGFRFPRMLFYGSPRHIGGDAIGTFGAGLFTTYDSDLDFGRGQWRLWPGGRPSWDGLTRLQSRFLTQGGGAGIIAHASLDGVDRPFTLDTGDPGEVSLDYRAAKAAGLWAADRPYAPIITRGIGRGTPAGRLVRGRSLAIGPQTIDRPLVGLTPSGDPSDPASEGRIGIGALAHVNLSSQVSSGTIWVQPNTLAYPRRGYPKSGLWVEFEGGPARVTDVGTGSPAAAAGVRPGDLVIGDRAAIVRLLSAPAGTTGMLTTERDGKRRDVALTLADYL